MNVLVTGAVLVLVLISLVSAEGEINEKRHGHGWKPRCRRHRDCLPDKYCYKSRYGWIRYCKALPRCSTDRYCILTCRSNVFRCSKETGVCESKIKFCKSHNQCDSATECCSWQYGGSCKKRPGEGKRCCITGNPCGRCSAGLQCKLHKHSWSYGTCQVTMPTTAPPPTTEPGSGEMDESLVVAEY